MKIESFFLEKIRGLPAIELDFIDAVTGRARARTVIAGSNGTGKTTILDTIHALASLLLKGRGKTPPSWLGSAGSKTWVKLTGLPGLESLPLILYAAKQTDDLPWADRGIFGDEHVVTYGWTARPQREYGPPSEAVSRLQQRIEAATSEAPFPNILYFPSERRELQPKRKGQVIAEEDNYQWVYRFSDNSKWEGSLESFLVAMDYRDLMAQREAQTAPGEFQEFLRVINRFLAGKRIVGVNRKNFRVQIEAENGARFSIDELSSGEKQILLMLGEIQRRIQPGSIVLIDEPEIHLHPQWQRLWVHTATELCATHDAQLLITTHSEEIANAVYEHELILLDAIFAQEAME